MMIGMPPKPRTRRSLSIFFALILSLTLFPAHAAAQKITATSDESDVLAGHALFRMERIPVGRDAELLTVFGSLTGLPAASGESADVPLVSILRDTLGDDNPENDRLRYVWMLTYTRPTAMQRVASAVPFLYRRVSDKKKASRDSMPPPVIDLSAPDQEVWERFMWVALKNIFFNPYGVAVKSSVNTLTHNLDSYRQAHILRALAILSLYEAETGG
ncbi:MAG: hypothetical protein LC754_13435, partial [Acidobacteria bacterium]|nr:hypothetical protein [Acidobacteriota bacterium]